MPDEILHCPAGTHDLEGERPKKKAARQRMRLDADGFLPEPSATVDASVLVGDRYVIVTARAPRAGFS